MPFLAATGAGRQHSFLTVPIALFAAKFPGVFLDIPFRLGCDGCQIRLSDT
jgi:hypothetical protein